MMQAPLALGNFSQMASHYRNRAGYSHSVLQLLLRHVAPGRDSRGLAVVDVGAGTGKLTEDLLECGLQPVCVEPNDEMRSEGQRQLADRGVEWRKGRGEETGLGSGSVDWLLMGSSFHWVDPKLGLAEFHRVLKPRSYFTAIWNPRNIQGNVLHERIEAKIRELVPHLKRVSSGAPAYTDSMFDVLTSTGHFEDVILVEGLHQVSMTPERYMGAWRSVNDIQVQAGEAWPRVLEAIQKEISGLREVVVPYRTRSFTARRVG